MKKIIFALLATVATVFQSCNAWLDVKPVDRITEGEAFSSPQGFKLALNGIYIELASDALYGRNLTYEFVDILAHRYAVNSENTDRYELITESKYTSTAIKSILSTIWAKSYETIANINYILENCESNRAILPDNDYAMIKGECLALRAMLHFEMLRLYAQTPESKRSMAIPYYDKFSFSRPEYPYFDDVIVKIINDLNQAASLIKPYDPVIKFGNTNSSPDNFLNYRVFRLNYYAVKAIAARVYLYGGINDKAFEAAKEVLAVAELYYPFTQQQDMDVSLESPDRVFSSEAIFAIQRQNRGSIYRSNFEANFSVEKYLYSQEKLVRKIFDNNLSDLRYKTWFPETKSIGPLMYSLFERYKEGGDSKDLSGELFPLIRITEMYYIAAEADPSIETGREYLNKVRRSRALGDAVIANEADMRLELTKEYTRDFWGEGQLFYYYKRLTLPSFPSAFDGDYVMSKLKYQMPRPEGEVNFDQNL